MNRLLVTRSTEILPQSKEILFRAMLTDGQRTDGRHIRKHNAFVAYWRGSSLSSDTWRIQIKRYDVTAVPLKRIHRTRITLD